MENAYNIKQLYSKTNIQFLIVHSKASVHKVWNKTVITKLERFKSDFCDCLIELKSESRNENKSQAYLMVI